MPASPLTWFQLLLLALLLVGILRLLLVFVRQNWQIFRKTNRRDLLIILGRTFLLWSPILLFAVPQYFFNRSVHNFATRSVYDSGLVERHYVDEHTTLSNLYGELSDTSRFGSRITGHLRDAVVYAHATTDSLRDANEAVAAFDRAFAALEPGLTLDSVATVARDTIGRALDLVARRQTLVGHNAFQLDTELTLQDIFREREEMMNGSLDSLDQAVSGSIDATLDSIDQNLSATSSDLKGDLRTERQRIERSTDRQFTELERQTIAGYETAFPPRLTQISARFGRSDCGLVAVSCRVLNGVKGIMRGVYAEQREVGRKAVQRKAAATRAAAQRKVRERLGAAEAEAFRRIENGEEAINGYKDSLRAISRVTSETVADTQAGIEEVTGLLNTTVRNAIWSVQRYLYFLRIVSLIALLFLSITSFIYVFSRVAFARDTNLFMTLRRDDRSAAPARLTAHGSGYTIPANHTEKFYLSKKYVPTGRAPKLAIPQPLTSVGRRLLTGNYFMNEVAIRREQGEPVDFRATAGAEFVEWELAEEDELIFLYEYLVALSEGIRLSSHLSLRLTTLLVGRPIFYIARGPGRVVLQTKGAPILSGQDSEVRSVSAGRVVAWQRPALFSVESETGLVDIYFSSLYLQRSSPELVLIDADDGKARQKTGLFRYVLRFLLPI